MFDFLFSIFGLYFLFSCADLGTVSVCFLSLTHSLFLSSVDGVKGMAHVAQVALELSV